MSLPKINALSVAEINAAMRQSIKLTEALVAKSKADLTGLSKIVLGPPGPSGKTGSVGPVGPAGPVGPEPEEGMNLELLFNNGLI